jgi:hypothetical protein
VAALYKEVGAGAHDTRFAIVASRPTDIPIQYKASASHEKSIATATHAVAHHHGHWLEFLEPRCRLSLSLSDLPLSQIYQIVYR